MSNARDSIIVLRGEARHAVLLRVHAHGTELEDLELLSIPRQANLAIEDRASILGLDGDRRGDQEGTCDHERDRCANNVKGTFCEGVLRLYARALCPHDRHAQGLDMFGACDDHVARMRNEVAVDVLVNALLEDSVAQRRLDAGNKHCLKPVQHGQDLVDVLGIVHGFLDLKALLHRADLPKLIQVLFPAVEHERALGRMQRIVEMVCAYAPKEADQHLRKDRNDCRPKGQDAQEEDTEQDVRHGHGEEVCQRLRVEELANAVLACAIGVVDAVEKGGQKEMDEEQRDCNGKLLRGNIGL